MKRFIFIFLIIFVCFVLYGKYINTTSLTTNEFFVESKHLVSSFDGLKIIHFSDILYNDTSDNDQLNKMVKSINELNPDIVVFTGDLFNKDYKPNEDDIKKLTNIFNDINSKFFKYAIVGDNDQTYIEEYKSILTQSGFKLLDGSYEYFFYKDIKPIKFIGLNDISKLEALLLNEDSITPTYNIVLTHYSDNFKTIKDYEVDLVLAGNALGGQVRIPFIGGLFKKEGSKIYLDAYYEENDTYLYVSNGIGTEGLHFRAFNTPSINLYRLKMIDE